MLLTNGSWTGYKTSTKTCTSKFEPEYHSLSSPLPEMLNRGYLKYFENIMHNDPASDHVGNLSALLIDNPKAWGTLKADHVRCGYAPSNTTSNPYIFEFHSICTAAQEWLDWRQLTEMTIRPTPHWNCTDSKCLMLLMDTFFLNWLVTCHIFL